MKLRRKKRQNSSLEIAEKQAQQISNNHSPRVVQPNSPSPPSTPGSPMEKNGRYQLVSPNFSPKLSPRLYQQSSSDDMSSPKMTDTRDIFDELSIEQKGFLRANLPLLIDISSPEKRSDIFISKLKLCSVMFNSKST
ncbi:hypothetical protein RFI_20356, partial [Reticulomyxa filosa]